MLGRSLEKPQGRRTTQRFIAPPFIHVVITVLCFAGVVGSAGRWLSDVGRWRVWLADWHHHNNNHNSAPAHSAVVNFNNYNNNHKIDIRVEHLRKTRTW